jgi:hypothetical protein
MYASERIGNTFSEASDALCIESHSEKMTKRQEPILDGAQRLGPST